MLWAYIFLGILQGIFEWIPVSSEGIVAIASQYLLKELHPIDVALFLHLGTLFAVLIYFRKDWKEILCLRNKKLFKFLVIATIISLAIGFPIYKSLKNITIGAGLLLVMGFGLLITGFLQKTKKSFNFNLNLFKIAAISGFLQGLSVIPGLSRSGSTIFGLSLTQENPSKILKLSYMMSAPVVLASSIYLFFKNPVLITGGTFVSLIFSFLVGIFTLHYLIKFSQKINFSKFAFIFGLLCLLGALFSFLIK